jgi:serine/threonine protein kinase
MMTPLEKPPIGYDIEEEIGQGDLTIIYRARRKEDDRPVAVKVIAPQFALDPYFVRRFIEAGQRATRLDHPNIVRVHEADRREEVVYVVYDLIEDESLSDWLSHSGPLSPERAVPIMHQLAAALDYAHSQRIMHGDLNDLCVFVGDAGHVTSSNFGLTQAIAGTDVKQPSVGTPEYLAPERVKGQGPSRPADIYALGVLAYQMLSGHTPFSGEPADVLRAQTHRAAPSLHAVNPSISVALSEAIDRALSKQPELRYSTATEFSRAFAAAAEGIAPVRRRASAGRAQSLRLWQRPLFWAAVVAPVLGLFLAVLIWNLAGWGERQASRLANQISSPGVTPTSLPPATTAEPVVAPFSTATATQEIPPSPTPSPEATQPQATPAEIANLTPGVVTEGSPFDNLVLARDISQDYKPISPSTEFTASAQPVYLFFDYLIQPGTRWGHVWIWGDQELDRSITTWPEDWGAAGTAWVYYTPEGGYQPGPYEVQLLVNDEIVASATFVMR